MVRLSPGAEYRISKRGLVIAGRTGETVLFEHPRADALPALLAANPGRQDLEEQLGPPLDRTVIADLIELEILTDAEGEEALATVSKTRRCNLTRSGLTFTGVATPARWLDTYFVPLLLHPVGRIAACAVLIAGAVAFIAGRPDLPAVTARPALEVILMLILGSASVICHELAHAVAMVHYGKAPQRAGFGFYWGDISFFVDSTPAMTLPRTARVIQALAGLAVDSLTTAGFAIAAHLVPSTLLAVVCWRVAILGLVEIVVNLAPILEVDGHWALADWLDEPDLSSRSRRALGAALRGKLPAGQGWLARYGLFSLVAGITLLAASIWVFWTTTRDLIVGLFAGNPAEIALGVYYVAPAALGAILSAAGLVLEPVLAASSRPQQA
jgi:hypothetical protein